MTRLTLVLMMLAMFRPATSIGQNSTSLSLEAALTGDQYHLTDPGGAIRHSLQPSGLWGIAVRQELGTANFLETGIVRKYYSDGVNFKSSPGSSYNNAFNAWMIPLRFGTYVNLRDGRIYLVPSVGYNLGINSNYGETGGTGASGFIQKSNGDKISYSYQSNYNLAKTFSLVQAGIAIEFKLMRTTTVSLNSNYYIGFKSINHLDILYAINNNSFQAASASGKGNMLSFGARLSYRISGLWKNREK